MLEFWVQTLEFTESFQCQVPDGNSSDVTIDMLHSSSLDVDILNKLVLAYRGKIVRFFLF